jgi:hypothetical protein
LGQGGGGRLSAGFRLPLSAGWPGSKRPLRRQRLERSSPSSQEVQIGQVTSGIAFSTIGRGASRKSDRDRTDGTA